MYVPERGMYQADPATLTGLAGYPADDVRISQVPGILPARAGVDARAYVATLSHLETGVTEYFDAHGNAIASIDSATGRRTDRAYAGPGDGVNAKYLRSVIDPAGQITTITYDTGTLVSRPDGSQAKVLIDLFGGRTHLNQIHSVVPEQLVTNLTWILGDTDLPRTIDITNPYGDRLSPTQIDWDPTIPGSVTKIITNQGTVFTRD